MENNYYKSFQKRIYSMFPSITEVEWAALKDIFLPQTFRRKSILSEPGKAAGELYFINKGSLRLCYPVDGELKTVFFAFENQFTGPCRSFMLNEINQQVFETLEESELLVVNREPFINALEKYPRLAILRSIIAEENLFITEGIVSFLLLNSPEERYKTLLKTNPLILQRVAQHLIASYLGVSPVSLSRIRKRLAEKTKSNIIY